MFANLTISVTKHTMLDWFSTQVFLFKPENRNTIIVGTSTDNLKVNNFRKCIAWCVIGKCMVFVKFTNEMNCAYCVVVLCRRRV